MNQREKAELLLRLQQPGSSLLLPNAWDAASARLFEETGFPAIGTTSAGIAYAHGYPDGEQIPREEMLQAIARIVSRVQIPVTADIEAGYGETAADVAETIRGVIAAGAIGVNLEDGTGDPARPLSPVEVLAERIAAAREAANRMDIPLVINARTDTYLAQVGEGQARLEETVRRGRAYLQAGADSIFVPYVIDPAIIQILVRDIPGPISLLAIPGGPSAPELFRLGVVRISIGSRAMLATMSLVRKIAEELRDHGTYEAMSHGVYRWAEAQTWFASQA
ncbi:MAG: isocitrate lyase/phosphoenolpyruvate mutase family protein [Chloroflexi bacterium]|nr:isocitrate lyase/phosphoenolpyruvate mutase family protein [Chloroflexota bacterium]